MNNTEIWSHMYYAEDYFWHRKMSYFSIQLFSNLN